MPKKTNYLKGSIDPFEEDSALEEMCSYLVGLGKYPNRKSAKDDAIERIMFFEMLGLYKDDPQLQTASISRKSVHALIYGHDLHDLLEKNNGLLPDLEKLQSKAIHPLENLFSLVESEFQSGASEEAITQKLIECGLAPEKASQFCETVKKTHRNRMVARSILVISVVIILVSLVLFFNE